MSGDPAADPTGATTMRPLTLIIAIPLLWVALVLALGPIMLFLSGLLFLGLVAGVIMLDRKVWLLMQG
jgi:hypothetical protein